MDSIRLVVLLVVLYLTIGVLVLNRLDKIIKEILQERGEDINEWEGPKLSAQLMIYAFWPIIIIILRGKISKESIHRLIK